MILTHFHKLSDNFLAQSRLKAFVTLFLALVIFTACSDNGETNPLPTEDGETITIFFINDPHAQLENFSKIKHIVDASEEENRTLLISAGDLFSGSPYVDQYPERGFPIIDVMNKTGFDLSVLGNHEFDYGLETLQSRIDESEFDWILANVNTGSTVLEQPEAFKTLEVNGLRVTFLGLIETYGRQGAVVPATHPWRIRGLEFQEHTEIVDQYENLKNEENSDVYIALTHIGIARDISLANNFPYFDAIIGGHSNTIATEPINGIPTLMAGADLQYLGQLDITVIDREVIRTDARIIDLETYGSRDEALQEVIDGYLDNPTFDTVLGTSESNMDMIGEVGCFYTTALKEQLQVDLSIQNLGGIRSPIDQGEITKFEIFQMDPFNNQSVIFDITVGEIKTFLRETGLWIAYTGYDIQRSGDNILFTDDSGNEISDSEVIRLGVNDFIPALYEEYFSIDNAEIQTKTTAEQLIDYLTETQNTINFEGCDRRFAY